MIHACEVKRECRVCKAQYMRKYRADGRYQEKDKARWNKIKNSKMSLAKTKVFLEVRSGRLKKANLFKCVDCGQQAQCYDHRDYLKPLEIDPVCRSCNWSRGPGKNKLQRSKE